MKMGRGTISSILLLIGLLLLMAGIFADNRVFTWISAGFLLGSLILGGRWLKPRR